MASRRHWRTLGREFYRRTRDGHLVVSPLCGFHEVISTHRGVVLPAVLYWRDMPPTYRWRVYVGDRLVMEGVAPSLETAKASATTHGKRRPR